MIKNKSRGVFAKAPGQCGRPARLATWRLGIGGPRWTGARGVVHRSMVDRGRIGRARGERGCLAATAPWPASRRACSAALWSTGNDGEGTGVLRGLRRARCARWLRGSRAGEDGLCGGAARRRWRNCGEIIRVKGRERYGGKGTVGIPTSLQSSGNGFSSVRRVGARDRRRWLELLGAAMAVHC